LPVTASLKAVIDEFWFGKLGRAIVCTVPRPADSDVCKTGVNDAIASLPPGKMLAAVATKTLESFGKMAPEVGFPPVFGAFAVEVVVEATMESPETSIWNAAPG
jgi:hypothetical protein